MNALQICGISVICVEKIFSVDILTQISHISQIFYSVHHWGLSLSKTGNNISIPALQIHWESRNVI